MKLEQKAEENSEMEEKIETTLSVEVKEDTGQGSMNSATRTRLGTPSFIIKD